jgi:hypothetical protein
VLRTPLPRLRRPRRRRACRPGRHRHHHRRRRAHHLQLVEAAEITALILASTAGLALAAGGVYAVVRLRAHVLKARARSPIPARVIQLGTNLVESSGISPAEEPAIEAPQQRAADCLLPGGGSASLASGAERPQPPVKP